MAANVQLDVEEDTEISKLKNAGFTEAQCNQLLQLLTKNGDNHSTPADNFKTACVAGKLCLANSFTSVNWIVDSGATDHMCHDLSMFAKCTPVQELNAYITIPNGKKVLVTQMGDIQVTDSIILKDVLYVPDFRFNLISIPKICKDLGCTVTFIDDQCFLHSPSMKLMHLGNFQSGLYYLEGSDKHHISSQINIKGVAAPSMVEEIQNKIKLWHLRMDYLLVSMLHHIKDLFDKPCLLHNICQICPVAKRQVFPHSSIKTTTSCSLLHLDIWGPYKEPTYDNCKYFFTVMDDFSRMTWVFL